MTNPILDLVFLVFAVAGVLSLFLAAPVCFLLFTKILLFLIFGKGVGQLKRTMRLIGLFCVPAFIAWVAYLIMNISSLFDIGFCSMIESHKSESIFFWVPFYGAALSFVFYLGEKTIRRKGGRPRDRYYIIWFLFFLITCYGMMLAWPFLPGPR